MILAISFLRSIMGFHSYQPNCPRTVSQGPDGRTCMFFLIVFVSLIFGGGGCAVGSPREKALRQAMEEMEDKNLDRFAQEAERFALVHGQYVSSPKGKFLLIRRGSELCAVRITSYRRGHDATPRTFFHTGDETTYAEYDWVFQEDGSSDLTKSNVESGHDELSRGAFVGVSFHLSMQLGNFKLECGEWELQWYFPTVVHFWPVAEPYQSEDFEMAPTNWAQISEIDLQNPRLRWYSYRDGPNATREDYIKKLIPPEDLPGGQAILYTPNDPANLKD